MVCTEGNWCPFTVLNLSRGKDRLGLHDHRHHHPVCQLPAVAGGSRCLARELEALRATVAQLQKQLAAARKDSSNSSKPPSSDIVKPPKPQPPAGQPGRKPGGQPGHPAHQRELFPPEMLASIPADYLLDACPSCGGHLFLTDDPPIVVQQVDIAAPPLEIHEHRSHPGWCPYCQKPHYAPFPLPIGAAASPGRG